MISIDIDSTPTQVQQALAYAEVELQERVNVVGSLSDGPEGKRYAEALAASLAVVKALHQASYSARDVTVWSLTGKGEDALGRARRRSAEIASGRA